MFPLPAELILQAALNGGFERLQRPTDSSVKEDRKGKQESLFIVGQIILNPHRVAAFVIAVL